MGFDLGHSLNHLASGFSHGVGDMFGSIGNGFKDFGSGVVHIGGNILQGAGNFVTTNLSNLTSSLTMPLIIVGVVVVGGLVVYKLAF